MWDGCGETHLIKLNSLHRRAAKLLFPDKNSSTDEKMKALSVLPLQEQLYFNKAVLMFKVNRRMAPSYIISLFTESNNRTNRYVLPKPRIDLYKTSLSFSGSTCWNLLPAAIKTVGTIRRHRILSPSERPRHFSTLSTMETGRNTTVDIRHTLTQFGSWSGLSRPLSSACARGIVV